MSEILSEVGNAHDDTSLRSLLADDSVPVAKLAERRIAKFNRYLDLYVDVTEGRYPVRSLLGQGMRYLDNKHAALRETLTTSDFPILFGDVIGRELLGNYKKWPTVWQSVARRGQVPDFRGVKRFALNGAESTLPIVHEVEEYPASSLSDSSYTYSVTKRGRRIPLSMEVFINDDLGALRDIPIRLGNAAARSEDEFFAKLFSGASGPNTTFFSSGNKNQIITANQASTNNPSLSLDALDDVYRVAGTRLDADGQPILIEKFVLMVPPQLAPTAKKIMRATEIRLNPGATTGTQPTSEPFYREDFTVVVNPYLNVVNTTNGATAWYVFASPANGRPSMEIGFLRGMENPQILMKASNQMLVGGGMADPMMGDFESDGVQYKVRHIFGGVLMDPAMAYVSLGTNS